MLDELRMKYVMEQDFSSLGKMSIITSSIEQDSLEKLKKVLNYRYLDDLIKKSVFVWIAYKRYINDTPAFPNGFGVISVKNRAKRKFLYWTDETIDIVLENPVFFTSAKDVLNHVYSEYVMMSLDGRGVIWYGPNPEKFIKEE